MSRFGKSGRRTVPAIALSALLTAGFAFAQTYTISTLAGGAPPTTPATATATSIGGQPHGVASDKSGNIFFSAGNAVYKLSSSGTLTLVAGNSRAGYSGDGGQAVSAQLNSPVGVALDSAGNLYISDALNNVVRMVSTTGIISTFAGSGVQGYTGDGGPATSARFFRPSGIAVDASGNVYIADRQNHAVRKVTTDGNINTLAGNRVLSFGYSGNGGPANQAQLTRPTDVCVDSKGNVYIADYGNYVIRQVTTDGNINTYAGNNTESFAGDGGVATSASLDLPFGVAVDSSGNLYISTVSDNRIRKVTAGTSGTGTISTIAGNGTDGFGGDGSAATSAMFSTVQGVAVDPSGNIYAADSTNLRIRKVAGSNISTVAGNGILSYSGDGASATKAQLNGPTAVAQDASGNTYIADTLNNVVRQVTAAGVISTFAGTGTAGFAGDGGAANKAQLNSPQGVTVDSAGNVYIADSGNHRVRVVSTNGNISTFAGNGSPGNSGDGAAASGASFYLPVGLATDKSGNLYITDYQVGVVRRVASSGTITTVAGIGASGYSGDGGPAAKAQLNGPAAVALDASGNLYIAETNNNTVRMVSTSGIISTIAGTGANGYSGEGVLAINALLSSPTGIAVDSNGNVFVSQYGNRIGLISPADGTLNTIAGDGNPGYIGDGGPAIVGEFDSPSGMSMDAAGNLYVADSVNNAVRLLTRAAATISVSGVGNGASNQAGAISPGEVVIVYGSGIGPTTLAPLTLANPGQVATATGGSRVLFNGIPAPMLYAWSSQVSAVVPFGVSGSTVRIVAQYGTQTSPPFTANLAAASPALFTADSSGQGQALALNSDGTNNNSGNPIQAGSVITLYATGVGQTTPPSADGAITLSTPAKIAATITATIGGQPATVQSATTVPQNVAGVAQINVVVPAGVTGLTVPVTIQTSGISSPSGVTIAVQ